jgi:hypothetical protein
MPEGSLKAREIRGNTGVLWKPGYMALPKYWEALTRVLIKPRPKDSTIIEEVYPLFGSRDSVKPGTYREALIMATNKRAL